MPSLLLYSTNAWIGFYIAEQFRAGLHHVWCSEAFDSRLVDPMVPAALVPPSSNPAEIYRTAVAEVLRRERHHAVEAALTTPGTVTLPDVLLPTT